MIFSKGLKEKHPKVLRLQDSTKGKKIQPPWSLKLKLENCSLSLVQSKQIILKCKRGSRIFLMGGGCYSRLPNYTLIRRLAPNLSTLVILASPKGGGHPMLCLHYLDFLIVKLILLLISMSRRSKKALFWLEISIIITM